MKKVLILAIVAVLSLGLLAACGGGGGPTHKLEVVAGENGEMKYNPDTLSVKKGETVEVTLVNKDSAQDHTFVLPKYNVKTRPVKPNQKETVKFVAKDTGTFDFECDVPGHKDGGMLGKITVTQ